jgi:catechol 2,3-dioxygenase-like lactoylglutathione lyase family enzyme
MQTPSRRSPVSASVSKVANVIVPVADQDAALRFYTESLGLELRADIPFGDGNRWIEVAPAGADTPIAICPPGPNGTTGGKETGISLQTDDIDAYHARLREHGVDVDAEVSRYGDPVPPLFWFRDPEGNTLLVVEVR